MKNNILLIFILIFTLNSLAQTPKNNQSIGFTFSGYYKDAKGSKTSNWSVMPYFGQFLSQNWFLETELNAETDLTELKTTNRVPPCCSVGPVVYFTNRKQLTLNFSTRYFFNPNAQLKTYALVNLGGSIGNISVDQYGQNHEIFSGLIYQNNYAIGLGAIRMINSEINLDGRLSYGFERVSHKYTLNGYVSKHKSLSATLNLTNFVNLSKQFNRKSPPQYFAKNRQILDAQLHFQYLWSDYQTYPMLVIRAKYGIFLTKYWQLSGGVHWRKDFNDDYKINNLGFELSTTYFQPISKRFSIYGKFTFLGIDEPSDFSNVSIGLNCFITKYLSLDFNMLNYGLDKLGNQLNLAPKIRMVTFLR